MASVHGVNGTPRNTIYAATEGGIIECTRAIAAELAPFGIRVNVISSGAIWLEIYEEAWLKQIREEDHGMFMRLFGESMKDDLRDFQPLKMVGMPDDIAHCAVYLASDESRFVTGQNIVVDGGLTTYLSPYAAEGARGKVQPFKDKIRSWIEECRAE